ncbi:MAG TPA: sigma-70 family RNA polymerase sigma factor [Ohtaekwangia sp.]|uniref:RNA polymerase sigma factor n=1 Tax=Ohtaekwangia sp. TaxID=2066019 RepID=UPI002F950822
MHEPNVNNLVSHLFRHEAGKMTAVLTRLLGFGSYEQAQDIVQDALLQAMSVWKYKGIPDNPSAWLYTVAKRKAIDVIRQQRVHEHHEASIAQALQSEWTLTPTVNHLFLENEIEDSQLRMIFACCHPAIPYESQVALTLKTLCGLSTAEIANAFLTGEETIAKRIYRAREKIREEKINLEVPPLSTLNTRLDAVLHTLYLLFNEGYTSSHPDQLIRHDLCEEAIRLCLLLTRNTATNIPSVNALLALMCYQASRADSRIDEDGSIILLKDQDRSRWNKALIERGNYFLETSAKGDDLTEYHLEAIIASCHAEAATFAETDWNKILDIYTLLSNLRQSPIVEMNKAIALGYAQSFEAGLTALQHITQLNDYYLYHAAVADFYAALNYSEEARQAYLRAIALTSSGAARRLLEKKIQMLQKDQISS